MTGYLPYVQPHCISIKEFYGIHCVQTPTEYHSKRVCYDFWEMVYVIDGEFHTNTGNAFYTLPRGSLIIYRPLEFHTFDVASNKFADIFIMSFSMEGSAIDKLPQFPLSLNEMSFSSMEHIIHLFINNITEANSYTTQQGLIHPYHQMFLEKPLLLPKICALTEYLLLCLCDISASKVPSVNNYETKLFFALTEDMKRYKDQLLTIEELAALHSISPTNAKTLIKKYSGFSLHQYYLGLKISQALELFRQGYNISQASLELGFCNPNHFSTIFKKITGDSPSQYLRKLKEVL